VSASDAAIEQLLFGLPGWKALRPDTQLGQMMLVLVGRRHLGLGYVLPRMCDEALRGFGERPGVLA
jgi:hypothetical protein